MVHIKSVHGWHSKYKKHNPLSVHTNMKMYNDDLLHECRLIAWMPTYYNNDDLLHECRLITWMSTYCMNADLLHECRLIAWMPTYYMNDDLLQEGWLITWTKIYYMNKDLLHEKRLNIFLEVIQKCIWEIIKWRNQLHWLKLTMVHTLCLEGL